jgi:putative endonuclease
MITTYAIFDKFTKEVYVGLTNDLDRRISEHKRGQSKYTRKYRDIELFYTEECENYVDARKREKYFKSGCGKEFLKIKLREANLIANA